jgi:hypothetical protein
MKQELLQIEHGDLSARSDGEQTHMLPADYLRWSYSVAHVQELPVDA